MASGSDVLGGIQRPAGPTNNTGQGIYIGVAAGSDLEQYGMQTQGKVGGGGWGPPRVGQPTYTAYKKPLYKVGYQNSKQFARELNNMDPNVIYLYQQRLNAAGMLDAFTPGKLDKSTRAAFKELLTQANQTASTWQQTLQDIESVGGAVKTSQRQPFVAQLDDPATLREAFQGVAQSLYGGDLPDAEVNAMVDSYRSIQQQKQQAAYNTAATGGTVENEATPADFAAQEIRAKHPDQVNRVKFADTLGAILKTFSSQAPA